MPTTSRHAAHLDLAPLYRNCLLSSHERQESHTRVAQEFSDHQLTWGKGVPDTVMYRANAQALSFVMLRYGAEINIRPEPFDDFALIHITLQGMAEIESDGQRVSLPPGRSALLAPRRDLHMHWQQDSEQLILKVPGHLLRSCGAAEDPLSHLQPVALLPQDTEVQWTALLQTLLTATTAAPASASSSNRGWIDHLEKGIASYVLQHHAPQTTGSIAAAIHGYPSSEKTTQARAERLQALEQQRLNAMNRYMQSRLAAPIGLEDLAKASSVSVRSLHSLCMKHYGLSPMEHLRELRLQAVRTHLLRDSQASVTDTALQYGFGHLGRFSAYYRDRFGELPSASRRAA